ncbi:MAG: glucose-1-phosphate cytidylyltransferase [Lachnospiraceae bacterium]|nr:glucose-1-phosphate cytidylyltransferase [Lachnospiraceae bacterium]
MKVVILAGGFGTRISEESRIIPKPMIEIGGKPIIWHIMKEYSKYGFNEFLICAGYKQHVIKEWFANYYIHTSDVTFDFTEEEYSMKVHSRFSEPWKVTVIDTGLNTMTGGRIKRMQPFIGDEPFLLTYGDGLSDVNISKIVELHEKNNKIVTLTSVEVAQRFGVLELDGNLVKTFKEKHTGDDNRINAGYMVVDPRVFDYIEGDSTVFEKHTLELLASKGEVITYKHDGFWQCMDTKREKDMLEEMWNSNKAPWKTWED